MGSIQIIVQATLLSHCNLVLPFGMHLATVDKGRVLGLNSRDSNKQQEKSRFDSMLRDERQKRGEVQTGLLVKVGFTALAQISKILGIILARRVKAP